MPAFYLMVVVGVVLFWVALAKFYPRIGGFFKNVFLNAKDEINKDDEE